MKTEEGKVQTPEVLEKDERLEALLEKRDKEQKMEAVKKALLRGDKDGLVISLAEVIHSYPADVVELILDLPYFDRDDEEAEAARLAFKKGFHNCLTHEAETAQESILALIMGILDADIDFGIQARATQFSKFCGRWSKRGLRGVKQIFSRVAGAIEEAYDAVVDNDEVSVETAAAPVAEKEVVHAAHVTESPVEIKFTPAPRAKHAYILAPKPPGMPVVSVAATQD